MHRRASACTHGMPCHRHDCMPAWCAGEVAGQDGHRRTVAFQLTADAVAQVQDAVAPDHRVRVLEQVLGIDRPEVPLA